MLVSIQIDTNMSAVKSQKRNVITLELLNIEINTSSRAKNF